MPLTKTDANGNEIYITDPNGNEITQGGKIAAGILLILVTLSTMTAIIAHWPDKLPPVNQGAETKYYYKWFAVTYAGKGGVATESTVISIPKNIFKKDSTAQGDSAATEMQQAVDSAIQSQLPQSDTAAGSKITKAEKTGKKCIIDLNTLILLLVALSGLLGNMIHVSASFTNFVGAGKFKRSWMLWYFVKPFTAAALAVGVYIIFRAGFLNSGEAVASVNLYGVVAIAVLAGLYTDMATQKLKEIFGVIFQTGMSRPDPLTYPPVKITDVIPSPLLLNTDTQLIISGEGFANRRLTVKINDQQIENVTIKPNALVFNYKADSATQKLVLYDEKNVEILTYDITVEAPPNVPTPPNAAPRVTDINPVTFTAGTAATVTITGTGLTATGITVTITNVNDATNSITIADADVTKTDTSITFNYTPAAAGNFNVVVAANGTELKSQPITVA